MPLQDEFDKASGPVDITLEQGVTMLFDAVNKDDAETIRALVAAGVPVDSCNDSGDTPLILSAAKDKRLAAAALLDLGADANILNKDDFNACWYAARLREREMSDLLLDHGAKPEAIARQHLTPMLVHAVIQLNEKLVAPLIAAGGKANAEAKEQDGAFLLHCAARGGNAAIVNMLIAAGANVNATDKNNASILRAALEGKSFDVVQSVLDAGADTQNRSIDSSTGRNTFDSGFATAHNDFEIACLVGEVAKTFEMIEQARAGKAAEVEALLKDGARPDTIDRFGMTALLYAVTQNNADVARVLLDNGARVNARGRQIDLPIVAAAWHSAAKVVPLLCEAGASVFEKDGTQTCAADLLTMRGPSGADEATCVVVDHYRALEIGREAYAAAHKDVAVLPMPRLRFRKPAPV